MPTDTRSLLAKRQASVDTETALLAAKIATRRAPEIAAAICGGLALHLYGFVRATQDVDLIASALLDVTPEKALSFGGVSFSVEAAGRRVTVDWIVRDDFFREFYETALAEAQELGEGLNIITPEWLATLKYIAGRGKDQIDLLWLLQQPGLVDRAQVLAHFERIMGPLGAIFPQRELQRLFAQADTGQE
jgi:hypothetical protein